MSGWSADDLAKAAEGFLDGTYSGFPIAFRSEMAVRARLMEQNLHTSRSKKKAEFLEDPSTAGRERIVIFGAGEAGRRALKRMPTDLCAIAFCDNDPQKWGIRIENLPVIAPAELGQLPVSKIVIASQYQAQIYSQLQKSGISPERIRVVRSENLLPVL
jgi:FlaA1/EpsC-like NDP-sugar epimerase